MPRTTRVRLHLWAAAAIAAAALGTAGAGAHAAAAGGVSAQQDGALDAPTATVDAPITDAEMADLTTLAEQQGMTLEQAIGRYAWNDNFALAMDQIRQRAPGSFAGAEIVDEDTVWVAFAENPSPAARAVIDGFLVKHGGVGIGLRSHVGFTEPQLARAVEAVHVAALRQRGVLDATTSYSFDTGTITTTVTLGSTASARVPADTGAAAVAGLRRAVGPDVATRFRLSVEVSSRPAGGLDSSSYHHGGESLGGCTSGFGTRASSSTSGTRGISTAGHCANSLSDDGSALTFQRGHQGTHGDFQWHTGPRTMSDDFYAGSTSAVETDLRDVSGVANPTAGQSLCKNGKSGFKDCQQVRNTSVCSGSICNLVQMGARLAEPGDSGGPVYWGNTAYGLHHGWHYSPTWPFDRDLFSRATRIDDGIGVYVATN